MANYKTIEENRLALHQILCDVLGSRNVYFQPPEDVKIVFPAIIYELEGIDTKYADDTHKYKRNLRYKITLASSNPEHDIVDRLLDLRYSRLESISHYDNLHNYYINIYF